MGGRTHIYIVRERDAYTYTKASWRAFVIEIGFFLYRKKKKKENEQVNSMTTLSDVKDDEKKENCEKR